MKIAVLTIPGVIASDPTPEWRILTAAIDRCLVGTGVEACHDLAPWEQPFRARADELYRRTSEGLGWGEARRLELALAGQALAYSRCRERRDDGVYEGVMSCVGAARSRLSTATSRAPLVILAHSLGCIVASDYLWDRHYFRGTTKDSLVTFGCPLAMCNLGLPDFGEPVRPKRWVNALDRFDVISTPLKGLNAAYAEAVTEDVDVKVGHGFTPYLPTAHMAYWGDAGFAGLVAREIGIAGGGAAKETS